MPNTLRPNFRPTAHPRGWYEDANGVFFAYDGVHEEPAAVTRLAPWARTPATLQAMHDWMEKELPTRRRA